MHYSCVTKIVSVNMLLKNPCYLVILIYLFRLQLLYTLNINKNQFFFLISSNGNYKVLFYSLVLIIVKHVSLN